MQFADIIFLWVIVLGAVIIVSLISLIGIIAILIDFERLKRTVHYLVSFAAGSLIGGAFIHLIPESVEEAGSFTVMISASIISGIAFFFILEKLIQWRHCHIPTSDEHPHSFAYLNLIGDGVHNFIDGLIIAGGFLLNINLGIVTTIAVILHEIPQEIGDFGVLIYGGFKVKKALIYNFITALTAIAGAIFSLLLTTVIGDISSFLVPFAAGGFIYIGGSDLIPELNKSTNKKEISPKKSAYQLIILLLGVVLMGLLLFIKA
ncbi:MAG: ZIP family metal transporter [Candidatus Odinarchaeia archaeon]